jgi:hypothetical protein
MLTELLIRDRAPVAMEDEPVVALPDVGSELSAAVLATHQLLERVHFPTQRASFEAVLRLLIEQFNIEAAAPPGIWRPVLAEAESLFAEIAHKPLSGPTS